MQKVFSTDGDCRLSLCYMRLPQGGSYNQNNKNMTLRVILFSMRTLKQVSCAHIKKTLCDAKGFQYRWGLSPLALLHATSPRGELQPKQQKHDPTGHFIQHAHIETSFMCTHKKNPLRCKRFLLFWLRRERDSNPRRY